ncbi:hypothetical protein JXA12_02775 [Candidatus Woesearchaeota archaeon]|nr:hypothetical protein [Candidatus Woesearchaeota archaeon]
MLLLKFFGIMDLYSAAVMVLVQTGAAPWRIIITAAAWLLLKGWVFRGEPASMIDTAIGVYHLLMFFLPVPVLTFVFAGYLVIKGVLSLF